MAKNAAVAQAHAQEPENVADGATIQGAMASMNQLIKANLVRIENELAMNGDIMPQTARWLALARTDFEGAMMWLQRAIDNPEDAIGVRR